MGVTLKGKIPPSCLQQVIIVDAAVAKTTGSLSVFLRVATTNNTGDYSFNIVENGDMTAGRNGSRLPV